MSLWICSVVLHRGEGGNTGHMVLLGCIGHMVVLVTTIVIKLICKGMGGIHSAIGHMVPLESIRSAIGHMVPLEHIHNDIGHMVPLGSSHSAIGHMVPLEHIHNDMGHMVPLRSIHRNIGHIVPPGS